jgi:hypothetical protein
MFFLTKKQKAPLESFCQNFYENSILNPKLGDRKVDVLSTIAQADKRLVADEDPRFADIDRRKLVTETINLRFELFGLALLQLFGPALAVRTSGQAHSEDSLTDRGGSCSWHESRDRCFRHA